MKRPILGSWILIWFETVLIANPDRIMRQTGVLLRVCGIVVQYGLGCRWFIGRATRGPTATRPSPRMHAEVHR